MKRLLRRLLVGTLLPVCIGAAADERRPSEETPYVISPSIVVDTMLEMAKVTEQDFLIDLGSGDGRIVIEAARRFKAQGYGVDYDPHLVRLATDNARRAGVSARISFYERDIFNTDFSQASVVTMYLLPEYNALLKPKLLALKPGTRIVSHDYGIDDWPPDAEKVIAVPDKPVGARKESVIYAWTVPAQVEGRWRSTVAAPGGATDIEFHLKQRYQSFTGTARVGGRDVSLGPTFLQADELTFSVDLGGGSLRFRGRVSGSRIDGRVMGPGGGEARWRAQKEDAS